MQKYININNKKFYILSLNTLKLKCTNLLIQIINYKLQINKRYFDYIIRSMTIKLYIDYMSQPSRAVWALCLIAKIPHEVIETKIAKLEMRTQQFRKINPMAKVPAIQDTENGLKLAQSHTIMRYLCNKYWGNVGNWYPVNDNVKRAKIDEYLDFHHTNTRKCSFYIFNSLFAKNLGIPTDPQFVQAEAKKNVDKALKDISKYYLANNNFITGENPTLADLSAYYEIQFLMLVGQDFEKWPVIKAWLERMGQIKQVREANKVFIKIMTKNNPNAKL